MLTSNGKARQKAARQGSYFFLSYAHSPPLPSSWQGTDLQQADPDRWVRELFDDLTAAVQQHASKQSELHPGFFDQDIPVGSDWKASLTDALSAAEVFVPLCSPGYYARSWPGREWACFEQRLSDARIQDPARRLVPVLWIPVPGRQDLPGLHEALEIGGADPAYAENGLRALLRLSPYRRSYEVVVDRVARRIVELAENAPVGRSPVRDIYEVTSRFNAEEALAIFEVAVAGTAEWDLPVHPKAGGNGAADRPAVPPKPALPLAEYAEYAARVAEQLDFAVLVTGIKKTGDLRDTKPGIILVDPWFISDSQRLKLFEDTVSTLPPWILPLLIADSPKDERTADLAARVRAILGKVTGRNETARRAIQGVGSLEDYAALVPMLVAEAERQYLRHGPARRSTVQPGSRPRLTGDGWPGNFPPAHPSEEGPDV